MRYFYLRIYKPCLTWLLELTRLKNRWLNIPNQIVMQRLFSHHLTTIAQEVLVGDFGGIEFLDIAYCNGIEFRD